METDLDRDQYLEKQPSEHSTFMNAFYDPATQGKPRTVRRLGLSPEEEVEE